MRKNVLIFGHNDATQFIDIYNQYTRIFDKNKYNVTVMYLTGEPNDEVKKRTLAENIIFLNVSKRSIRGLKIDVIKQVLARCRENHYDIVICHRYKPSYIMMWVNQFYKIPALICVMHEIGTMRGIKRQLLIAMLARKNTYFAGVSNAVRDDLRKSLWCMPNDRIVTLYNTIDIELTEPALLSREEARAQLHIPDDCFLFGNIARLVPNKDQTGLIQAFSIIKANCPKAKLIIMGDGELDHALKTKIAELHLQNDVILTGFLAGAVQYMKAFDCFVLSSVQEAFGRVLIEAMIAKLPIIATSVNGIPEVMATTGTLIKPSDCALLAESMKRAYLASMHERMQMGEVAYQHVAAHFSIPAFAKQFWQLPLLQPLKD